MASLRVPPQVQSGSALALLAVWSIVGHLTLLTCAALADLAAGGDFLARWLPGGEASQVEPWVGGPPISRLLAMGMGALGGVSLARAWLGRWGLAVVGALVLLPWLRHGLVFTMAGEPLALQPFLPALFWALGTLLGFGLFAGWRMRRHPRAMAPDEPTTEPTAWFVGAALVVAAGIGLGEASAAYAARIAWNQVVDRAQQQARAEGCDSGARERFAYAMAHAPEPVAARLGSGCEGFAPRRSRPQPLTARHVPTRAQRGNLSRATAAQVQPLADLTEEDKARRLAIVYQALQGGNVERERGGLARATTAVAAVRATGVPTVVLDAGGFIHLGERIHEENEHEVGMAANTVLDVAQAIGFDAICPGRSDLVLGLDWLSMQAQLRDLPYTSATLLDENHERVFPAYRLVQAGTWRIGIVCVTGPNPACEGCQVADGIEAARAAMEELDRFRPDVTIGLGNLYGRGFVTDRELVTAVPGFDFFLGSSPSNSVDAPEQVADTLVHRTRSRNRLLELLTLGSVPLADGYHSEAAEQETRKKIASRKRRLQHMETIEPDRYHAEIQRTRAQITELEALLVGPVGRNVADFEHLHLYREEEDPQVAAILKTAADQGIRGSDIDY